MKMVGAGENNLSRLHNSFPTMKDWDWFLSSHHSYSQILLLYVSEDSIEWGSDIGKEAYSIHQLKWWHMFMYVSEDWMEHRQQRSKYDPTAQRWNRFIHPNERWWAYIESVDAEWWESPMPSPRLFALFVTLALGTLAGNIMFVFVSIFCNCNKYSCSLIIEFQLGVCFLKHLLQTDIHGHPSSGSREYVSWIILY